MIAVPAWLTGRMMLGGVVGAFLLGGVVGGVGVRKIMDGTIARKQLKAETERSEQYAKHLEIANTTIIKERGMRELAELGTARLRAQLEKADSRYSELIENASAAMLRVPRDTVRIVNEGKEIGDELIGKDASNEWIRFVWDRSMYDHAFCSGRSATANAEACGVRLAGSSEVSNGSEWPVP